MSRENREFCCQCEGWTGRAGRADDSLYTDNDWGPYCEDCWEDAAYWRCLTDEKVTEIERLRAALEALVKDCPDCGGKGTVYLMDETEICQPPGSSGRDCGRCAAGRAVLSVIAPIGPEGKTDG